LQCEVTWIARLVVSGYISELTTGVVRDERDTVQVYIAQQDARAKQND
jgi:hypothetical protein